MRIPATGTQLTNAAAGAWPEVVHRHVGLAPDCALRRRKPSDIAVVFTLILAGTWAYSWFLSDIWLDRLEDSRPKA
ncbi:MAG: hypothetical protein OXC11_04645 [Rhodospirillales bacterium]|nr:hypothetical protein [Rhodospirillales bacterium]